MVTIDNETARKIILADGSLRVSDSIVTAIESCITSSYEATAAEYDSLHTKYSDYGSIDEPIKVDYNGETTIDAYTAGYLPRNTLLPKLLFLSLMEHPIFQTWPDKINILDLGSGTGSVVVGFLDLFKNKPFSKIALNINACEISKPALLLLRWTQSLFLIKHPSISILTSSRN